MSEMQWKRWNGATGVYDGPTVDLGTAIPRRLPDFGFRRAVFDLAFGYVNGFPLLDVIAYSMRSLFPTQTREALVDYGEENAPLVVGTVYISCPSCGEPMPATVSCEVIDDDGDGMNATLACTPDMTDIHAHVWSHRPSSSAGHEC